MSYREKIEPLIPKIIFTGLIIFYCGIYIFPDGGDISRIFYIFIMLPMLFVVFSLKKKFYRDEYLWLLMLLPMYLTLSHFWASENNIIKSNFFHIKKVIYIFFFLLAVFYISKKIPDFLLRLFQCIFILGFLSAIVSLGCFFSKECGIVSGRLSGFSVQDINKAGAMYTLHIGLSLFFLVHGFFGESKDKVWVKGMLFSGLIASTVAVTLAKTHATWFMLIIVVFFALIPKWRMKGVSLLILILLTSCALFFYFDGYSVLMADGSFRIRVDVAQVALKPWKENILFGVGLTHKLPLIGAENSYTLPHPHNIFIDVLRFGGIVGFLILSGVTVFLTINGMAAANKSVMAKFCLAWFVSGIAIMTVYAQQPITRPGGYIWFLYWMPIALLAAELSRLKSLDRDVSRV